MFSYIDLEKAFAAGFWTCNGYAPWLERDCVPREGSAYTSEVDEVTVHHEFEDWLHNFEAEKK